MRSVQVQGLEDLNKWMTSDSLNSKIFEIIQNTGKSPIDFRRLAVIQIPVKNHQLTLVWKNHKRVK